MGYKALGYVVWNGGKWYLKRKYGVGSSSHRGRNVAVGLAGVAIVALAVGGSRRAAS
jgi:hypothetical protein